MYSLMTVVLNCCQTLLTTLIWNCETYQWGYSREVVDRFVHEMMEVRFVDFIFTCTHQSKDDGPDLEKLGAVCNHCWPCWNLPCMNRWRNVRSLRCWSNEACATRRSASPQSRALRHSVSNLARPPKCSAKSSRAGTTPAHLMSSEKHNELYKKIVFWTKATLSCIQSHWCFQARMHAWA